MSFCVEKDVLHNYDKVCLSFHLLKKVFNKRFKLIETILEYIYKLLTLAYGKNN